MPIRIANNITALNARRRLAENSADFTTRVERLSSGLRINRGADDAAGLSVSEGMRSQIVSMRSNVRNAEQGINMIQLAEGSLNEVSTMLRRMRELAVQSSNSTINDINREGLSAEFDQLSSEIDRIATSTSYNGQSLLTGFGNAVKAFDIDAYTDDFQNAEYGFEDLPDEADRTNDQNNEVAEFNTRIETSTALRGYAGVRDIAISGADPGSYVFEDTGDDNKITLVFKQDGEEVNRETISVGSILDVGDDDVNMVATGTTVIANFDRLGVQVTLYGPEVESNTAPTKTITGEMLEELEEAKGTISIGVGEDMRFVEIEAGDGDDEAGLKGLAQAINVELREMDPPGYARYNDLTNKIEINTGGHDWESSVTGMLQEEEDANYYVDGRLHDLTLNIEKAEGGSLQIGPDNQPIHRMSVDIKDMRATGNELNLGGASVSNLESARSVIQRVDAASLSVARQRGNLGALQNRLGHVIASLENGIENLTASESSIRDADIAMEMTEFTKAQILTQASTAMVAQANALPQSALQLLQ